MLLIYGKPRRLRSFFHNNEIEYRVNESVLPRGRLRRLNVRARRDILLELICRCILDNLFSCINRLCLSANYMYTSEGNECHSSMMSLTLLFRRINICPNRDLMARPNLHARISQYAYNTWQDSYGLKFRHSYSYSYSNHKNSILQIRTRIEQLFDVYVYLR